MSTRKINRKASAFAARPTKLKKAGTTRAKSILPRAGAKRPAKKKRAPMRRKVKSAARVEKVLGQSLHDGVMNTAQGVRPQIVYQKEPAGPLPFSYNETRLVLLVRDPHWAYGYWDFSTETWNWIQDLRHRKTGIRSVLRVKNLDENSAFDIDVQLETKNWYLNLGLPNVAFEAELGMIDASGKFYLIARSNRIRLPSNGPSRVTDSQWPPERLDEIYRLSGGGTIGHGSEIFSQFKKPKS